MALPLNVRSSGEHCPNNKRSLFQCVISQGAAASLFLPSLQTTTLYAGGGTLINDWPLCCLVNSRIRGLHNTTTIGTYNLTSSDEQPTLSMDIIGCYWCSLAVATAGPKRGASVVRGPPWRVPSSSLLLHLHNLAQSGNANEMERSLVEV